MTQLERATDHDKAGGTAKEFTFGAEADPLASVLHDLMGLFTGSELYPNTVRVVGSTFDYQLTLCVVPEGRGQALADVVGIGMFIGVTIQFLKIWIEVNV